VFSYAQWNASIDASVLWRADFTLALAIHGNKDLAWALTWVLSIYAAKTSTWALTSKKMYALQVNPNSQAFLKVSPL
jgi:hypothetical protein